MDPVVNQIDAMGENPANGNASNFEEEDTDSVEVVYDEARVPSPREATHASSLDTIVSDLTSPSPTVSGRGLVTPPTKA